MIAPTTDRRERQRGTPHQKFFREVPAPKEQEQERDMEGWGWGMVCCIDLDERTE